MKAQPQKESSMSEIPWNPATLSKFKVMIGKLPIFHRRIAENVVPRDAGLNAQKRNSSSIEDEDLVRAFFSGVPAPFRGQMKQFLDESGLDYKKYGLE